jgi:adenosine deaminase
MNTTEIESFIKGLPKAELHLHIEGSLEPELLFDLAARNSIDLPFADVEACRAAYSFTDLQSFLDIYYQGASVLLTELDFFDLMKAYLRRAHADGVRRAEIFFDPQTHTERGIGFDVFMAGFGRAIEEAEAELGISAGLIMCFLRHLPGSEAVATFTAARDHLHQLIGVGLDSSEVDHPPGEFAEAFALARDAGLHLVAHAGEEGPPEYIVEALDVLGVERIDHGVRCEDDPKLVQRLADTQMPLTVCPFSNLELAVVDRLEDHNLKRLMDHGLLVTVNSDDPAYFGGYVADNYLGVATALQLSKDDLVTLAQNSFHAAFITADQRAEFLAEIEAYVETAP